MYKLLGADQKQYGPVSADQVRQWIVERRLNGGSLAQLEGAEGWKPLAAFPEFSASLAAAGPISPTAPFSPAPAPGMYPLDGSGGGGTNGLAIASLVLGIVSILGQCCCLPVLTPVGIIFAAVALAQLKNRPAQAGRGIAWAGLILNIISLVMFVFFLVFGQLADRMKWFQ